MYCFKKLGVACVRWKFPLDMLDGGHMSTLGHVSKSGRVQWKFPLDMSRVLKNYMLNKEVIKSVIWDRIKWWELWGCLVRYFEQQFSVFKQFKHHTYFYTLFYIFLPTRISNTNNVTRTILPNSSYMCQPCNITKQLLYVPILISLLRIHSWF